MKNSVNNGTSKRITAAANIVSGQAVVNGVLLGVALGDILAGAEGVIVIEGVFELPKAAAAVIADGAALNWDISAGEFGTGAPAAGDLVGCAVAMSAAGAGATTVLARLAPGAAAVVA